MTHPCNPMRGQMIPPTPTGVQSQMQNHISTPPSKRRHDPDAIFAFIVKFKTEHDGNSPTVREIGDGCGIPSTATVTYILGNLEKSGRICTNFGFGRSRSISVTGGEWRIKL